MPPPSRTQDLYRGPEATSQPHLTEGLISKAGPPDDLTAELPDENAEGETQIDLEGVRERQGLPWWKRPSPWWVLCAVPFMSMAMAATSASRIEVYTILVCRVARPEVRDNLDSLWTPSLGSAQSRLCAADPAVRAAVAEFTTAMTASMGVLSCLTAGWWGAFSDRHGRGYVMGISAMGLLLTDFTLIFVAWFPDKAPGGYWFLILGPIVEGALGGFTSAATAIYAYQADTTDDHNKSRIFSLGLGLLLTGTTIGLTLGALLIKYTGRLLSVFYAATGVHILYTSFVWFFLPQSLSMAYRHRARERYAKESRASGTEYKDHFTAKLLTLFKGLFAFLAPLSIFIPPIQEVNDNSLRKGRDWNLTFLALAYGIATSVGGSYTSRLQYAASTFDWTSEDLEYWLSLVAAAQALFLIVILPAGIKFFKPKPVANEIKEGLSELSPLLAFSDRESSTLERSPRETATNHSSAFDLGLAQVSLLNTTISYTLMGLAPSPITFTLSTMLDAMGAGFAPAIQAVALALYTQRGGLEPGRLFGGLGVLQAIAAQAIGPALYGIVYAKSVGTHPQVIFFVAASAIIIASSLLSYIRLPKQN